MLTIALVNNMPPAAIAATERHFRDVLTAAAGDCPFQIRWFRLAGARPANYENLADLWASDVDGLIVTGVEPKAEKLPDETFWPMLCETIEWAKSHTTSAIWSCLAAHAAVLYLNGIERRPHDEKIFGVFDSTKVSDHPLLANMQPVWRVPHSRWNDLREDDLTAHGYTVLAKSVDAGVDLFVKSYRSLFVFIQTHPEYDVTTLMREYRRDISRHVEGQPSPAHPKNYFANDIVAELLSVIGGDRNQKLAILQRAALPSDWSATAIGLYRNWFTHLLASRNESAMAGDTNQVVPTMSDLFPPGDLRIAVDDGLTRLLVLAEKRMQAGAVVPTIDLNRFRADLANYDFAKPCSLLSTIDWVIDQMEHGLVHVGHPRYFGLFNPTPTFPAQVADRITGMFNPQLATWTTSPVAVEIEAHVVRAVADRAGFSAAARGHFTSGGSEANYTAAIAALTKASSNYANDGVRAFGQQPVFYVSQDCHLAWIKIAHQAGLGRSAVRFVPTDKHGSMDVTALLAMLSLDESRGLRPFMIVATAGTTNAGAIDPLASCAMIARENGLWCHVDAAWGGGLLASDGLRCRLKGIEQADSVTIDAHKWFAATMGCGIFITQHPTVLNEAFNVLNSYMPSNNVELDPYVSSVQWSRRFMGLRLFMSLATVGWTGYGHHVEHSLRLIDRIRSRLEAAEWLTHLSPTGVLCVEPRNNFGRTKAIVQRVLASGQAWVSAAVFRGRDVIRLCVTSGVTTEENVNDLVEILIKASEQQE